MARFWLSPWRPQGGPHRPGVGNVRGDEMRDFVSGTVYLTDSMGGWGWSIRSGGKIVETHRGWGSTNKGDGLRRAERAAREFDEKAKIKAGKTGQCRTCGKTGALTEAGRVREHPDPSLRRRCEGSGRKPKAEEK